MVTASQLAAKLNNLKSKNFGDVVIPCMLNSEAFDLVLMTAECATDTGLMTRIGDWRRQNEIWFPAIFNITTEGTARWFENLVIGEPDRVLFMIRMNGEDIGHIALYRFNEERQDIELDNILRGVEKHKGIIEESIRCLISWARKELGIPNFCLQAASENARSLRMYERLNFHEQHRKPVIFIREGDGGHWEDAPEDYNGTVERYELFMVLENE